ncbi:hypothetical protein BZG36_02435 [Bifiguratus adelaidae]|uniref:Ras-GEF domain-containing protein n=1 Tax=Bifiguratus adelaidae TaxID=1938954 RepID=A0A261Y3L2_9FUNG|nr:hypothetical protein BZG36_02435 [Bifiguratus adelaidae]
MSAPLIPLSKLARRLLICEHKTLNHAAPTSEISIPKSDSILSEMNTIKAGIKKAQGSTLFDWTPKDLAIQVCRIDLLLFQKANVDWQDVQARNLGDLEHLQSFHRYLFHSFIHQVIVSKAARPTRAKSEHINAISYLLHVAQLLLFHFGDFSGFAAVILALSAPEVQRLKYAWDELDPSDSQSFQRYRQIVQPDQGYSLYFALLERKIARQAYSATDFSTAVLAIPWLTPIQERIKARKSDTAMMTLLLSVLSRCRHATRDPLHEDKTLALSTVPSLERTYPEVRRMELRNMLDIGPENLPLQHWVLSRVFLFRNELWQESLQACPLQSCEVPPTSEEDIVSWDVVGEDIEPSITATSGDLPRVDDAVQNGINSDRSDTKILSAQHTPVLALNSAQNTDEGKTFDIQGTTTSSSALKSDPLGILGIESKEKVPTTPQKESDKSLNVSPMPQTSSPKIPLAPVKPKFNPAAREFVPRRLFGSSTSISSVKSGDSNDKTKARANFEGKDIKDDISESSESEMWTGYPGPTLPETGDEPSTRELQPVTQLQYSGDDDEEEVWTGYPALPDSEHQTSQAINNDEEWKGYTALTTEDEWNKDTKARMDTLEWKGYALETSTEDDLDRATVINGVIVPRGGRTSPMEDLLKERSKKQALFQKLAQERPFDPDNDQDGRNGRTEHDEVLRDMLTSEELRTGRPFSGTKTVSKATTKKYKEGNR